MTNIYHNNYHKADTVKSDELGEKIKKLLEGKYGFPTDDVKATRKLQREPFDVFGLSIMTSGQPSFEGYELDSVVENLDSIVDRIDASCCSSIQELRVLRMPTRVKGNRTKGKSYVILTKSFY